MLLCLVNGEKISQLPVTDRGLAFGDGLFTTAKISQGTVELLAEHIHRLESGCKRLGIAPVDYVSLEQQLKRVAVDFSLAVMKVTITSGSGGRGYSRPDSMQPTIIISVFEFPSFYRNWQKQGIRLGASKQHLGLNPLIAGIKHLNRLEQVLIKQELDGLPQFDELVVTDINHHIIECSASNIFWLKDKIWYTPALTNAGVAGIMASKISGKLSASSELRIGNYTLDELEGCEAMFICNCLMGIVPIALYLNRHLSLSPVQALANTMGN